MTIMDIKSFITLIGIIIIVFGFSIIVIIEAGRYGLLKDCCGTVEFQPGDITVGDTLLMLLTVFSLLSFIGYELVKDALRRNQYKWKKRFGACSFLFYIGGVLFTFILWFYARFTGHSVDFRFVYLIVIFLFSGIGFSMLYFGFKHNSKFIIIIMRVWQFLKSSYRLLEKRIVDMILLNKEAVTVAVVVAAISVIIFVLNGIYPVVNQSLLLSADTQWGIITSIFVHGNIMHIELNLIVLMVWTFYIIIQNDFLKDRFLSRNEITKRLKFSMVSVFGSVIASNILWLIISRPGTTTLGSSGVVFAFSGVLFAFSLMNFMYVHRKFRERSISLTIKIWNIIWNIFVCASLSILVIFQSATFFGTTDPQTNAFVHLISFLLTFISVSIYEYYPLFLLPLIHKIGSYIKSRK